MYNWIYVEIRNLSFSELYKLNNAFLKLVKNQLKVSVLKFIIEIRKRSLRIYTYTIS